MKWIALGIMGLALLIIAGTTFAYLLLPSHVVGLNHEGLVKFGSYFGGVAGPLLGLLTFGGVILTLWLQREQLQQVEDAQIADRHVRALNELFSDLQAIEQQTFGTTQRLAQILDGQELQAATPQLPGLLRQYIETLGLYAAQVDMYRDNVSPYWDCRAFVHRGKRLLERVRPLVRYADQMAPPAIDFIEMHLNGERERS